jgi:argininosuccinate lyase
LLLAIAQVETAGIESLAYQSGIEDLFFHVEGRLIEICGAEYGGNLQLACSRNDLGHALTRMALRPALLGLVRQLLALRHTLLGLAQRHVNTVMPGYTHTQPAQPTTFAHYLAGVLSFLQRDTVRLQNAYRTVNQSPLGGVAFTGTGFEIDRELLASLLGYAGVMASSHDSIGASDHQTDIAAALTSLGVNLSRMTHDLLFKATRESGAIRIDDSFIQISSIMPQKRNPVVLEHLRARLSRLLGMAQTIVTQCHNIPYGDTQDIEDEIEPTLFTGVETAVDILHLYKAVFATLHIEAMSEKFSGDGKMSIQMLGGGNFVAGGPDWQKTLVTNETGTQTQEVFVWQGHLAANEPQIHEISICVTQPGWWKINMGASVLGSDSKVIDGVSSDLHIVSFSDSAEVIPSSDYSPRQPPLGSTPIPTPEPVTVSAECSGER